jgi:probable rRNA maturation factor
VKLVRIDRRSAPPADDPLYGGGSWWRLAQRLCAPLGRADWQAPTVLVDDAEMAELNGRYRGRPEPTDVLAFPYLAPAGRGACVLAAGRHWAFRDLWHGEAAPAGAEPEPTVGEIVVAPGFVRDRCLGHGWDFRSEWAMLMVHGALHLLGWDHASESEGRAMRAAESELLAAEGLQHPLGDAPAEA